MITTPEATTVTTEITSRPQKILQLHTHALHFSLLVNQAQSNSQLHECDLRI